MTYGTLGWVDYILFFDSLLTVSWVTRRYFQGHPWEVTTFVPGITPEILLRAWKFGPPHPFANLLPCGIQEFEIKSRKMSRSQSQRIPGITERL
jgi:hypothetical protein